MEAKLGEGSFGQVFKVRSKEDGKRYAVKKSRQKFNGAVDRLADGMEWSKVVSYSGLCTCTVGFYCKCMKYCVVDLRAYPEGLPDITEYIYGKTCK